MRTRLEGKSCERNDSGEGSKIPEKVVVGRHDDKNLGSANMIRG